MEYTTEIWGFNRGQNLRARNDSFTLSKELGWFIIHWQLNNAIGA